MVFTYEIALALERTENGILKDLVKEAGSNDKQIVAKDEKKRAMVSTVTAILIFVGGIITGYSVSK